MKDGVLVGALMVVVAISAQAAEDGVVGTASPIVNGRETASYPTVASLLFNAGGALLPSCTGTLIGCETILTAAHCFCDGDTACVPDPSDQVVFLQHAGFFEIDSVSIHPDFEFGVQSDLALVRLASPVTGIEPTPINDTGRPNPGTMGLIAGFGSFGGDDAPGLGLKAAGRVTTETCSVVPDDGNVCWSFDEPLGSAGDDSNTCSGDSGGPLFVNFGDGPVLAGVTSGGISDTCFPLDRSWDTDVFLERAWIQAEGGADLDNLRCGSGSHIGDPETTVLFGSGTFAADDPPRELGFVVPSGVDSMLVTLNGEETGDLDLGLVSPASTVASCDNTGGAYGACEVAAPMAGTWSIQLANAFSFDDAGFQITTSLFEAGVPASNGCVETATALCLNDGRFRVTASWATTQGTLGVGQAVPLTDDTGYFWFFNAANVEAVIKVLDACGFADRFWVFAGGLTNVQVDLEVVDTVTGEVRVYNNDLSTPFQPIQDTGAFGLCSAATADGDVEAVQGTPHHSAARAAKLKASSQGGVTAFKVVDGLKIGTCVDSDTAVCLNNGRFRVEVDWATASDGDQGLQVRLTEDTAYYFFFDPDNVEVVLKVLDGCAANNHYWFFAGGLTNVEVEITVTDTLSGSSQSYTSPLNTPFQPILDTGAFATCP